MYIYYEPIKNKIYLTDVYGGKTPKKLFWADDGQYQCNWTFSKPEYRFYLIGEV